MLTYKNHGTWTRYQPEVSEVPTHVPANVLFLKRESDNQKWYDYRDEPANWTDGSIKLTVFRLANGSYATMAVQRDQSYLSPLDQTVIEIFNYVGSNPIKDFGRKYVDLKTLIFTDPPAPSARTMKADVWRRCTDEEAETLLGMLNALPARKRQLYTDCQYLQHDDPFFAELRAAVIQAVGQERADVILAAS